MKILHIAHEGNTATYVVALDAYEAGLITRNWLGRHEWKPGDIIPLHPDVERKTVLDHAPATLLNASTRLRELAAALDALNQPKAEAAE